MEGPRFGKTQIAFGDENVHEVDMKSALVVDSYGFKRYKNYFSLTCSPKLIDEIMDRDTLFIVSGMYQREVHFKLEEGEYRLSENFPSTLNFSLNWNK